MHVASVMPSWIVIFAVFVFGAVMFGLISAKRPGASVAIAIPFLLLGIALFLGIGGLFMYRSAYVPPPIVVHEVQPPIVTPRQAFPDPHATAEVTIPSPTTRVETSHDEHESIDATTPAKPTSTPRPAWVDKGIEEQGEGTARVVYATVSTDLYATVAECERTLPGVAWTTLVRWLETEGYAADESFAVPAKLDKAWEADRFAEWNQTSQGNFVRLYVRLKLDQSVRDQLKTSYVGHLSNARAEKMIGYMLGTLGVVGLVYGALKLRPSSGARAPSSPRRSTTQCRKTKRNASRRTL
ncbi:MAG: hypothetical protein QM811_21970 [Pirellulales bacterium]